MKWSHDLKLLLVTIIGNINSSSLSLSEAITESNLERSCQNFYQTIFNYWLKKKKQSQPLGLKITIASISQSHNSWAVTHSTHFMSRLEQSVILSCENPNRKDCVPNFRRKCLPWKVLKIKEYFTFNLQSLFSPRGNVQSERLWQQNVFVLMRFDQGIRWNKKTRISRTRGATVKLTLYMHFTYSNQ